MRKQFGYSIRPTGLTSTFPPAQRNVTADEVDNYVETLTNTITSFIAEKVPTHKIYQTGLYGSSHRNKGTNTSETTSEVTLAKDKSTAVQE